MTITALVYWMRGGNIPARGAQNTASAPPPAPAGTAGAVANPTAPTPTPTAPKTTWGKPVLAVATLVVAIVINLWGGEEILSALKDLKPAKFLWLLVLVPLFFFIKVPKGLMKNAGSIFGWVLAVAGVVVIVWFATQDPLRWWHDDNKVIVDLNRVDNDTVSLRYNQTLVIRVRHATVLGRSCKGHFEPAPKWRQMYGMNQPENELISYTNQGLTTYVSIKEPYRTMLRDREMTMDIWVYNHGC